LLIAFGYRRARKGAEEEPLALEEAETLREELARYTAGWRAYRRLIRSKSGYSETLFIQADPAYGLRRERAFFALAATLLPIGLVLLLV